MSTIRFSILRRPLTIIACAALAVVGRSATAQESPAAASSASTADAELAALREEVRVLRQDVQRLTRAITPARAEAAPPGAVPHPNEDKLIAKTYVAADLVLPLQKSVTVTFDTKSNAIMGAVDAEPDFGALEELIMSRIAPSSWAAAGGEAEITPFPGNLSLVIVQNALNHRRIAELFEALRARRKIELDVKIISGFRSSFLNQIANLGIPMPNVRRPQLLSAHQAKVLLDTAQNDRRANLAGVPPMSLVPGQLAQFCLPAEAADTTNVLIRADVEAHSQVRLTVVANAQNAVDALRSAASVTLGPGEPVLIDIPQHVAHVASSDAIPLAERLSSSAAGDRALLLVTPRIVNHDSRELLGVPSTP